MKDSQSLRTPAASAAKVGMAAALAAGMAMAHSDCRICGRGRSGRERRL